ncbi:MAG: efflux RND transporter permease subunit, partial [Myxococcota bacterium]|nr:efflux RND transporter permease subunit [Myxococcota bacterium]
VLVMVIGVADAVHLTSHFHRSRRAGYPTRDAIVHTMETVGLACILTTATTAVAFLSLLVTQMQILHGFGIITAVGLCLALVVNLTLLPAGLALGGRSSDEHAPPPEPRTHAHLTRMVKFVVRPRVAASLVFVGTLLALGTLTLAPLVVVDFFPTRVLADDHPVQKANLLIDERMDGVGTVEVALAGPPGAFRDPDILRRVETLADHAVSKHGFRSTTHLAGRIRALYAAVGGDDFPRTPEQVAQVLLLAELGGDPLGGRIVDADYSHTRIVAAVPDRGGRWLLQVKNALEQQAEELFHGTGITVRVTGGAVVACSGFNTLTTELVTSLLVALVFVLLTVGVLFRSFRMVIVTLLPNTLPLLLVVSGFAILGRTLDLFPAMLFTIALGIAVDDTLHLVTRYTQLLPHCQTHEEAIVEAATQSLGAILQTTLILVGGFGVLTLSSFPANQTS